MKKSILTNKFLFQISMLPLIQRIGETKIEFALLKNLGFEFVKGKYFFS